jgi:hypothetical protein
VIRTSEGVKNKKKRVLRSISKLLTILKRERERELREKSSSKRKSVLSMAGALKKRLCLIGLAAAMLATPVMGVAVRNNYRLTLSLVVRTRTLFFTAFAPSFFVGAFDSLILPSLVHSLILSRVLCSCFFPTCVLSLVCWRGTAI